MPTRIHLDLDRICLTMGDGRLDLTWTSAESTQPYIWDDSAKPIVQIDPHRTSIGTDSSQTSTQSNLFKLLT